MEHINLGYNGNVLLKNIELTVRAGDRIGLLGSNGAGKTTLMRVLGGAEQPMSGQLFVSSGVKIGYYAQHQLEQLDPRDTPMSALERIAGRASTQEVRSFLGGFGFIGDRAFEVIEPFSGGEKARLALALLVWQAPNLLLLDEPTNHLDLEMRESLASALQTFEGALVVVSHDRSLIEMVCDGFWRVHAGQVAPFDGDLEDYRRALTDERRAANASNKGADVAKAAPVVVEKIMPKAAASLDKRLKKRIEEIEHRLSALVHSLQALDAELADPALYQNPDPALAQAKTRQREALAAEHGALEQEWLSLHD
jgi:ATP-binding cassette subfamily F protein 3